MSTLTSRRPVLILALMAGFISGGNALAQPAELASLHEKAEKGNSIAQYNLGLSYATGREVEADLPEAYLWLSLAATNGTTGKALNTLLEAMTPAQLAEGRRRLAAYRGQHQTTAQTVANTSSSASVPPDAARHEDGRNQLSSELAQAWKEADDLKARLAEATAAQKAAESELSASASELATLRAKIATLQNAGAQNSHSANAAAILQREINQLKAASISLGADNQKLEDIASQRGRERDMARNELGAAQARLATLEREHQALLTRVAALKDADQQQLATAQALENARAELRTARENLTRESATLASIRREQSALRAQLDEATRTNQNLRSELQAALTAAGQSDDAEIKTLNEEIASLSQHLKEEQAAHAAAVTRSESIARELSTTHHALSSGADELVALRIKVGQLEAHQKNRLNEETTALQNEIAQLTKQTSELSAQNQKLEDVAAERGRQIAALNTALRETRDQGDSFKAAWESLQAEHAKTQSELANVQAQLRSVQSSSNDAQSQLVTLRQQNASQQQEIARAESSLGTLRRQLEAAQDAAGQPDPAATRRIASLTAELSELRSALSDERSIHSQTKDRLTELTMSLEAARDELAHAQVDATQSQSEISRQRALLSEQQQLLSDLNVVKTEQQQRLAIAEDEVATLQGKLEALQSAADEPDPRAAARIADLQSKISTLETELSQAIATRNETDDQLSSLATTMNDLRQQVAQLETELNAARTENDTLRGQLATVQDSGSQADGEARSRMASLTAKLETAEANRADMAKQLDTLTADLGATRAQLSRLKDENIILSTRLDSAADQTTDQETTARLEAATAARLAAESQVAALTQDLTAIRAQLAQSEQQVASLSATVPADNSAETAALEEQVATALSNYAELQKENEKLKANTESLTAQIATLEEQIASDGRDAGQTAPEPVEVDDTELIALKTRLQQTESELSAARSDRDSLRNRLLALRTAPTRPGSPNAAALRRPTAPSSGRTMASSANRTHTVVSGDTLSDISLRYYGTSRRWAEIYEANRDKLPNERALQIGMVIVIP